jgi:hypothetical protein
MAAAQLSQLPSPEQIRHATQAVLERSEFAEPSRWYEILIEALKTLKRWLDGLGDWSQAHPSLARVFFIIALLVLLACLGHLFYLALADVLPFQRKKDRASARSARWDILEGVATNWREALQLARALLGAGNLRRAIWITHRVLLGLLDEQGAIKFAIWKTNSHYLAECARTHPWYGTFTELTDLYEGTVYANRSASRDTAESLVTRVNQFCDETSSKA